MGASALLLRLVRRPLIFPPFTTESRDKNEEKDTVNRYVGPTVAQITVVKGYVKHGILLASLDK